ncbi:sulfite exporter TauE/SafE family protein [Haloarcula halophila]|uniref:hypothetical protein n=1 Tax=Haloarcula TaxID=2237 RepID=UPI0023E46EE3|nr:hypothetical protein [Halomicroarcula sp. DFY41]
MIERELAGLLAGAVALGAVHGIEPGHGWPVAAAYAMEQSNEWVSGIAASTILGLGHLVSSLAMVGVFFYAKSYFSLTQVDEPLTVAGLQIGGPVSVVAGVLLIVLGIREYAGDHSHGISDGDTHDYADSHGHTRSDGHHDHGSLSTAADRGLLSIAWAAFLLGFAHEEEFEIIALCAGSNYCLELMSAYAVTVIAGIVGLTALLLAGYDRYEDEVERITPYLPLFSAAVLVLMGIGFVTGLF